VQILDFLCRRSEAAGRQINFLTDAMVEAEMTVHARLPYCERDWSTKQAETMFRAAELTGRYSNRRAQYLKLAREWTEAADGARKHRRNRRG